jgi:outer membrane protein
MKKSALLILFAFFGFTAINAQKVAYVDMEKIMESVPEYAKAQKELEEIAERWRQEISKEYDKIDQMYRDYQAREVLMSDDTRKQKQDEIVAKEKEVRELQKKRFGPEGELFTKRQSLVKPIQEKVYTAIEKFSLDRGYDIIFSAPDGSTIIYAKEDKPVPTGTLKIAHVDPEQIIPNMPEYKTAKEQLEKLKLELQAQMETEQQRAQQYYASVMQKVQQGILAPAQQKLEEDKLVKMQEDLQKKAMKMEEDMIAKEQEMTKPMYDKFNEALKEIAKKEGYTYVFDKKMMLYSDGGIDATDKLKEKLGVK